MIHRVRKSVSSVVRLIIGRVIVQKWMMVLPIRRSEILEPTPVVRGPAATPTVLVTNRAQRCETHKLALLLVGGRVKVSRAVSVVAILIKNNTARDF